jgi:chemotaxis protein MotB
MAKKARHEEHENHERWLVSYADFMTLLFALFTVLYASASTDAKKMEEVVKGMNSARDGGMPDFFLKEAPPAGNPESSPLIRMLTPESSEPLVNRLKQTLNGSLSDNVVQIGLVDQELTLVFPERFLFGPGSAQIQPGAFPNLRSIASTVAGQPVAVDVVGSAVDVDDVAADQRFHHHDAVALDASRHLFDVQVGIAQQGPGLVRPGVRRRRSW